MFLFISIFILCVLLNTVGDIIKLLKLSKFFWRGRNTACLAELEEKLKSAKEELKHIRESPCTSGEYAQTIKVLRAEEKVKNIEKQIKAELTMGQLKNASAEVMMSYGARAVVSFFLFIITVRSRYEPVIVFDSQRFNFEPLTGILSLPTGVPNAISVPMWLLSCNLTCRYVTNMIKGR